MCRRIRIALGLIGGAVVGLTAVMLFDRFEWFPNHAHWPLVLIGAIDGAAFAAWGFRWVRVSNEDYDEVDRPNGT